MHWFYGYDEKLPTDASPRSICVVQKRPMNGLEFQIFFALVEYAQCTR